MKTYTTSALRCAALVSAVSFSALLSAQTSPADPTAPAVKERRVDTYGDTKLKHSDESFFEKAAKAGMKEVTVSETTLDRLTNPQVKAFAQMMVGDHSKANAELMALAAKKGVTLPPKETKFESKWSKKTKDLDEDYMKEMVDDHEDAVKLFEKASKSDDAEIAAFAQKTLPTLQQHLTMARDLRKIVK